MSQTAPSLSDSSDNYASTKVSRASSRTAVSDNPRNVSPVPLAHRIAKELDDSFQFDYDTFYKGYLTVNEFTGTEVSGSATDSSDYCLFKTKSGSKLSLGSKVRWDYIAFIFITCISQFLSLSALNQTVSPVLILARAFGVEDYGKLSWFSASYSMSVGTFILPAGKWIFDIQIV